MWQHISKNCQSNILTFQVILKKFQEFGTVLSNGLKYHQTLILSAKLTADISHKFVKKLFICTESGPINYISDAYAGLAIYRFVTELINIAAQFTSGYSALFDGGFNLQGLFLQYKVITKISYFVTSKGQLTSSEVAARKQIARARVPVECVIGPLQSFWLPDHTLTIKFS